MTTVENALLQQMQKLAASMNAMQGAAGKDSGNQASVSFQEMLQKSGNKTAETGKDSKEQPKDKLTQDDEGAGDGVQALERGKNGEKEELKAENLTANPNAVGIMDFFRPEIVETVEQTGSVVNPIPQETVEGAALELGEQAAPEMEANVDAGIGAEVSMEQQPKDFQQAMEETPQQSAETVQAQPQQQQTDPERPVQEAEKPEREIEVHVEHAEDNEEPTGEGAVEQQPVFHDVEAAPVKVGETYKTVDTEKPEMDHQLADTIQNAVNNGQERVEIRLNPQNLGSLVIEMTKNTDGVLQVVLHAATPKTEGLLNQHLNSLNSALQGYGHEEVRLEVQRNEQSEQQNFRQADPDGRGQHQQGRQQEQRQEEQHSGEAFMQKLRLGLFGVEE